MMASRAHAYWSRSTHHAWCPVSHPEVVTNIILPLPALTTEQAHRRRRALLRVLTGEAQGSGCESPFTTNCGISHLRVRSWRSS
jgi:hypothetical protein